MTPIDPRAARRSLLAGAAATSILPGSTTPLPLALPTADD
jgi:hypothetical protein